MARDSADIEGVDDTNESYAAEGGAAGLATGAGVGALWGLGIIAGALPAIGPAIAGGTLAAILSSAAAGAAAAGLAGTLIGLGIPKNEAEFYEGELEAGRIVVTVRGNGRYGEALGVLRRFGGYDMSRRAAAQAELDDETEDTDVDVDEAYATGARTEATSAAGRGERTVQAREEELRVRKQPVETGEVSISKEVHTEHKTIEVPVEREEVVVERHAPTGSRASSEPIREGEKIRVPVREEQVHVE
jgi:stress response protein YsnF